MARKKLCEMTPKERVDHALKGASWDEAEEAGIEILARCMALHVYARKEGEEYFEDLVVRLTDSLMKKICEHGDEWAQKNALVLAMASAGKELKNKN